VEVELTPLIGTKEQSDSLIEYINANQDNLLELNTFGKPLDEMIHDKFIEKLHRMPEDVQVKFQETLQRIINEGSGGLLCIIL
jgi:stage IV sporulation protein A